MANHETSSIPTYQDLQRGHHPDISPSVAAKLALQDRRDLAVQLTLRDLFTPLSAKLEQEVLARSPSEIQDIDSGFELTPRSWEYPQTYAELSWQSRYITQKYHDLKESGQESTNEHMRELQALALVLEAMETNTSPEKIDYAEILDCAPGKFQSFYFAPTELQRAQRYHPLITPVGAYGEETAKKMIRAGRILITVADQQLAHDAYLLADNHEAILGETTARGADYVPFHGEAADKDKYYPLLTLEEGIQSLLGDLAFLIPEKLEGIVDGDKALDAVIRNGLPNQVAAQIPMGFLMPKVFAGRYYPGVISMKDGKPELSEMSTLLFDEKMKNAVQQRNERINAQNQDEDLGLQEDVQYLQSLCKALDLDPISIVPLTSVIGHGCNQAMKSKYYRKSGIEMLSNAFLHVYQAL